MELFWRRLILFFLTFLFFSVGPTLVLYSMGWKFDFERKKFVKTGTLYLVTLPKESEVFLDGKFFGKTSLIFGDLKIERLFPKKYKIEIKKENYFVWEKEIEIKEGQVLNLKKIMLFPKNLRFEKTSFQLPQEKGFKNCPLSISLLIQKDCFLLDFEPKILIDKEGNVFIFNEGKEKFELEFEKVKKLLKSKNGKRVAILKESEIWIIEKNGKKNFLLRESKEIKDLSFFNQNSILYLVENKIKFAEIDFSGKFNLYEIPSPTQGEKIWVENQKIFIFGEKENFVSSPVY